MSSSKKKKKSSPSLLLEPTIEEEQRIEQKLRLKQQHQWQGSSKGEGKCSNMSQDNSRIIMGDNIFEASSSEQMSRVASSTRATNNVINVDDERASKRDKKQLTMLLSFLFGMLLIIGTQTTKSVSSAATTTTTTKTTSRPQEPSTSSVFNSMVATPKTATSSEPASVVQVGPTPASFATSDATTRSESDTGVTTNTIAEPGDQGETATTTERIVSSSDSLRENATSATATIANSEEGEDLAEEDLADSDDAKSVSSSGGKLSSGFIIEAAGEAADQLLANLRPKGEEASEAAIDVADEEADTPAGSESTGSESAPVERRDVASGSANKPTTDRPGPTSEPIDPELKIAMDTYTKWRSVGDDFIELFSRKMLPVIVEHGYDIDAVTVTGLLQVFNGIRALKPWALKLLDASAKLTPGLLVGTQSDFGDFDECLGVRVDDPSGLLIREAPVELDESTGLPTSTLVGRYCLADIEFPKPPRVRLATRNEELNTPYAPIELRRPLLNFSETAAFKETIFVETGNFFHMLYVDPIRFGVCLTNKIDPDNFEKVVNKLLEEFKVSINFKGRCVTKYDRVPWTIQQRVSAWVILVACCLVILCTLLDILHTKLNKLPLPETFSKGKLRLQGSLQRSRPLFTSFSIIRNTKRLFRPQGAGASKLLPEQQHQQAHFHKQQQANILDHRLQQSGISANCSTSTSGSSYSSSESSPSIERRSSTNGSAVHLISDSSIIGGSTSSSSSILGSKKEAGYGLAHFTAAPSTTRPNGATSTGEPNLLCLHGIRVITMTWMIVNHTYLFGGFFVLWAYRRLIDIAEWPKSISFQLVLNGWLTVETYFFLGATILVMGVMQSMKAQKFTYITYVLHRLIRLLPAYTGLICLNFLWPLISSGPVWLVKGKSFIQTPCENYLWSNYLFINNWIWPEKQCMVHSWFLSADFQLYLMAPLIVYLLHRRPVFGHTVNIIVAMIASIVSGLVIYANKLMPTTLINKLEFDSIKQQLSYSYFATYQHVGPYCLGIFTGYLLYKRPRVQLPKHLTWALWILLPPLSLTTLFLTYLWNGAYDEPSLINPSPIVSALYVAIHRTIWTSLVAWIVFACATGRAKLLSSFLSHYMFIPLSRLSFSIYLVHLPVIMYRALNLRHTIEWTDSNILWEACGNFIMSLIVGYFVNITFESPFTNLEQVIFGRGLASGNQRDQSNSSSLRDKSPSSVPKLRPQLAANSKTASESDSDDSKSAKSSDLATIKSSGSDSKSPSSLQMDATASQLFDRHRHWTEQQQQPQHDPVNINTMKRKALRNQRQQQDLGLMYNQIVEPTSMSHYGDVDEDSDNLTMTPDSGSPVIGAGISTSNGQSAKTRNRLQQVAPVAEHQKRKGSAYEVPTGSKLDHSSSSSIYQMAPIEYQRYVQRQGPGSMLLAGLGGGQARIPQYATLAPTSGNRFTRDQTRASERHEYRTQRAHQQYHLEPTQRGANKHSSVGGSISRNSQRSSANWMGPSVSSLGAGSRREGRYNTLTGATSRDWHQDGNLVSDGNNWALGIAARPTSGPTTTNWTVQSGAMLPRIDSSTLRGASMRASDSKRTSSIVEEEREDIVRI